MDKIEKIWKWIDHNRFIVIGPIVGLMLWAYATSCTPLTESLLSPGQMLTERQLALELMSWQAEQEVMMAKFEAAGEDIAQQKENNKKIEEMIMSLASGGVADMPGLLKLLVAGGGLGAITDNIRKRGLISGLKINNKNT